jgi:DNA-binding NarL/FixJ family response regulator
MTTRVLLADDHKILRQGLQTLLQNEPDIEVVGQADNGRGAIELAKELRPDVVIMDVAMPDVGGVGATRELVNAVPTAKVVALSMHSDRRFVTGMLSAGASGYLLKDSAFEELALSIRAVMRGELYLSAGITGVVVDELVGPRLAKEPLLSTRETEVLRLLAAGKSTADMARELGVSVKTIETHRRQIMHKLGLHSVAELTKYAVREGLTSLDG